MAISAIFRADSMIHRVAMILRLGAILVCAIASSAAAQGVFTEASGEGPAQRAYAPAKGPGPAIVMISGQSGMSVPYQEYAAQLARLGYYTVLVDSNDIFPKGQAGMDALRKAIARTQQAPQTVKGKVGIVGFSLGGGTAIAWAANMPEQVSVVVAYYPFTSFAAAKEPESFVKRFKVPILVLAGARDSYKNCCLIEGIRAIETSAKKSGANFELVVYPRADHNFNHVGGNYRQEDDHDAWKRTQEMLKKYHPLTPAG